MLFREAERGSFRVAGRRALISFDILSNAATRENACGTTLKHAGKGARAYDCFDFV
jgi:hypothetical protein